MRDNRNSLQIKIQAIKRLVMWYFLSHRLNLILVTEYPKSGGSWFCQSLSEAIEVPFPRLASPPLERCILQGHFLYKQSLGKTITVIRDGRDVMVSAYFYFLFDNDLRTPLLAKKHRARVPFSDYDAVSKNMPAFIRYMFEVEAKERLRFSWSAAIDCLQKDENLLIIRYEDLLTQPLIELKRSISFLDEAMLSDQRINAIIDKYAFKKVSNRESGEERRNSFLRKGIAGDWKNYFNREACVVFDKYAGKALIKAGYEPNNKWVNDHRILSG